MSASASDWFTGSAAYKGFPADQRLRRFDFVILSRRGNDEPIWTRFGEVFTQTEAEGYIADIISTVK